MRVKSITLASFAAILLIAHSAQATGRIKVTVKDKSGHIVNGEVTAQKAGSKKICKTRLGICTIDGLSLGTWSVSFTSTTGSLIDQILIAY